MEDSFSPKFWGRRGLKSFLATFCAHLLLKSSYPPYIPSPVHPHPFPHQVNRQVDVSLLLEVSKMPPKVWVQKESIISAQQGSQPKIHIIPLCLKFSSAFLLLGTAMLPPPQPPHPAPPPSPFPLFLTISWGRTNLEETWSLDYPEDPF